MKPPTVEVAKDWGLVQLELDPAFFSKFCFGPKFAPKGSFGLKFGGTGPKNRQDSKNGIKNSKKRFFLNLF